MDKVYNMAYIGFGGMASHHYNQSKELDRINVKGVFDTNPERMEYAKSLGLTAYSSREELINDPELDLILIIYIRIFQLRLFVQGNMCYAKSLLHRHLKNLLKL